MPAAGPEEYLLMGNDGKTWAVTGADRDMYMNNYVGQTVTVVGDDGPFQGRNQDRGQQQVGRRTGPHKGDGLAGR